MNRRKVIVFTVGSNVGDWTIISDPIRRGTAIYYVCKCKCGTERLILRTHLLGHKSTSCGRHNVRDISGHRVGRLTVIKPSGETDHRGILWICKCDCGNTIIRPTTQLKHDRNQSCGCYLKRKIEYGLSSKKTLYNTYMKLCAGRRGIEFNLAFDDFIKLTSQECYYCGMKPSAVIKNQRGNGDYTYNGLDRIDNTRGYTIDNTVPCCKYCNAAKSDRTIQQFYSWVEKLAVHLETRHGYQRQNLGIDKQHIQQE